MSTIADPFTGRYPEKFLRNLAMFNYGAPQRWSKMTMNETTTTPLTTRQAILLQREAYAAALRTCGMHDTYADFLAKQRYPMPTITRPRVHTFPDGVRYRVVDGRVQYRVNDRWGWVASSQTPEKVRALAALLDNPTETVSDE